jgi:hypothetical protein
MKTTLFAALLVAGIGVVGAVPSASAAPVNGAAIGETAQHVNPLQKVQVWVWHGRRWHHRERVCNRTHFRHSRSRRECHWRYW